MNKNLTEMVFILDRSGSMCGLESDTIGGFNGLLAKQKKESGEARITTVLFDDQYEVLHDHADILKVNDITEKEYFARGSTALLDAIGKTIHHIKSKQEFAPDSEIPQKTMIVIITDGHENASRIFSINEIKSLIEHQKEKYDWEFLFLGANIDAISTAANFGIASDRAVTYHADHKGTEMNFEAISDVTCCLRSAKPITPNWKSGIEKHFKRSRK